MPDYNEKALHQRAAEFYERIAVTDSNEWQEVEDIAPQLRAFDHCIRAGDCSNASELIESVSFHLIAWGFFDRLIEMRQRLKRMAEGGDCDEVLDLKKWVANEGGLGLAYLWSGRPNDASVALMRAHLDAKTEAGKSKPRSASSKEWREAEGIWLGYLAWSEAYKGQIEAATVLFNEALEIAGETGDELDDALWRNTLGWLNLDYEQNATKAHELLSASVAQLSRLDKAGKDRPNRIILYPIWALGETDLGRAYMLLGHFDNAAEHFRQAIDKFRQVTHRRWGRGLMPGNVGTLFRAKGFSAQAKMIYEAICKNQREIGDLRGEQITYARLGNTHRDLGWRALLLNDPATAESELQAAVECFDKSVFLAREGKDLKRVARGLRRLGNVHREMSRLYHMCGKSDKRSDALNLACKYHLAHQSAPEGFVADRKSGDKDELWGKYYDWMEETRLKLESQNSKEPFPPASADFLKQVKTKISVVFPLELLMGIVLLRELGAYNDQGHKVTNAKSAFEAARVFAKDEKEKVERSKGKIKDLSRQHELAYALAIAHVGLALVEEGKKRKDHQIEAENLLREQITEYPAPGVMRDVGVALLEMQDPFREVKGKADESYIADSALDILRLGMAGDNFQDGSIEQQLFDEVWSLFPGEYRRDSTSSGA